MAPPGEIPSDPRDEPLPGKLSILLRQLAAVPEAEPPRDPVLRPGTVVGRFEIVREVGRGGFGIVYEARDRTLGRTVAFKAMRPGGRPDLSEERLLREAEAVARLSHPNVVTLYDVGRTEQGPYLVLEFLRGQSLARRLDQGPVAPREALRIALEVAKGVAHAHQHGIIHRDLTPGNVFLCEDGRVKVLDLGMAHAFGHRHPAGGTPGYMAPEQRRGAPEDERSDVFALGVMISRMLANEHPFVSGRAGRVHRAFAVDVPGAPAIGELLDRMLDEDPTRRPRDAGEVLAALTVFVQELERTPSDGSGPVRRRRRRRIPLVAAVAAALVASAAVGWAASRWIARQRSAAVDDGGPSVAVLPFADLSPGKDQEYFSDGLADEILNALARVDGLRVAARTSSFYFKGKSARLPEIGQELHVQAVLEGSVRTAGNRVRVTAQIVKVADGYRLWAQTYDRELSDVFAVQDDIARAVVDALDVKLKGRPGPSTGEHATGDPEVYRHYLVGREQYHRVTSDSLRLAVEAYERALAADPGYAPAWAGLGIPLVLLADDLGNKAAARAQRQRALAAAEKSVALSPNLVDGLSTRGYLRAVVALDWAGAKTDLERALALNPNDAASRRRYGLLLDFVGRPADAVAELRKAVRLDPLGQSWITLGSVLVDRGDLVEAETAYRRYLELAPANRSALLALGKCVLLQGRAADALAIFERCGEECQLWGRAVAEHARGNAGASRAALDAFASRFGAANAFGVAQAHAWRGEKDEAFRWLERSIADQERDSASAKVDPFLRPLRGYRRLRALLERMKLPID